MGKRAIKYNPAFLSGDELVQDFVVRIGDYEMIMEVVRENVTDSNQHMMVIGPRGIGKTMLALRVVEGVRRDDELVGLWYPIVFGEESYQVSTTGEFWLEALFHLSHQTDDMRWKRSYEELIKERNDDRLREQALGQLMDFADEQGKRILLVVENFNMLLGGQIGDDDAWKLRHTLLNEKRVMLLATATSRFDEIDNSEKAMFDLFRGHELKPLDENECRALWKSMTGKELEGERIRPVKILTGGSPRLLRIISTFGAGMSFRELMDDLVRLVDEHTEYFKSHLDALAAIERKVYLGLAELWAQSTAREVGRVARLGVSKTSSLLGRLKERGMVVEVGGKGKKKLYQVAERMYNIYYLMRRRGTPAARVKAVVHFMVSFYRPEELVQVARLIGKEACELGVEMCKDHQLFYEGILTNSVTKPYREQLLEAVPDKFREIAGISIPSEELGEKELSKGETKINKEVDELFKQANILVKSGEPEKLKEAELLYHKAIEIEPKNPGVWAGLGVALQFQHNRCDEAEQAYRKVIELTPKKPHGWSLLGGLFHHNLARYDEAEEMYRKAIKLEENDALFWRGLGRLVDTHLERYEEAEKAYTKAVELSPDDSWGWVFLGNLFHFYLDRYDEAEKMYFKAIELAPEKSFIWMMLGNLYHWYFEKYEKAQEAYLKAIEFDPKMRLAWLGLGDLNREHFKEYDNAEKAYHKEIELEGDFYLAWLGLGKLLGENLGRYEEAKEAYHKALLIEPCDTQIWQDMICLLLEKLNRPKDALKLAKICIDKDPKNPDILNAVSWAFYKQGRELFLPEAETWAQEAVKISPNRNGIHGTLATILSARGKSAEALEHAQKFLENKRLVETYINDGIDMFVGIAAGGFGREALEVLQASPSEEILEPLIVGLQMYIGDEVKAAVEIMEVGKDVAKRIEKRRKEIEAG